MGFKEIKQELRITVEQDDTRMLETIKKILEGTEGTNRQRLEMIAILANAANEQAESFNNFIS